MSPLAKHVEVIGNQLKVVYDDGTSAYAVPTQGSIWLVTGADGGTLPPDPVAGNFAWPYGQSHISDNFGLRSDVGRWHEGTDFSGGPASAGNPIPAIGDGVVELAEYYGAFGNAVIVNHGVLAVGVWAGFTLKTLSAHMSTDPVVNAGDTVHTGQTLGPLGNSGASFGAHLHLECHIIPPGGSMTNDYLNPNPAPPSNRTAIDFRDFMGQYNAAGTVVYP